MGKNKAKGNGKPSGGPAPTPPPAEEEGDPELGGLFADEVEITVQTIAFLAERPDLFMSKPFRELRAALDPLVQLQLKKYDVPDYGARVTAALRAQKWGDAATAMQGVRAHAQTQKQGTLQRWVRDCGFCVDDMVRLRLLDLIVRCGKGEEAGGGNAHDPAAALRREFPAPHPDMPAGVDLGGGLVDGASEMRAPDSMTGARINAHPVFVPEACARPGAGAPGERGVAPPERGGAVAETKLVLFEKAAERQPANKYDLKMFACCEPGWVLLERSDAMLPYVKRHDVPNVPGAFVMSGVLSRSECAQIIATAEGPSMGFSPHHPVGRDAPTGIDECEWLADPSLVGPMFERVRGLLPQELRGGGVAGVNPRFRLFRYGQGAVYRPHIDGSWPGGGLDAETGQWVTNDALRSRLTFLVYLNDGFEGGATTFYVPSKACEGEMDAYGVDPQAGAVLCFPQGNTASLVHEGSAVREGTKYVIRTDVLYAMPTPAAGRG